MNDFIEKKNGSFYSFLIEFNVVRNFKATKTAEILEFSDNWLNSRNHEDVDGFAEELFYCGMTERGKMTSLASKILFLNNPYKIFPMDRRVKHALGHYSDNIYSNFLPKVKLYGNGKTDLIQETLNAIEPFVHKIENSFNMQIENVQGIRINRFIDKLLWTKGR